MSEWNDKIDEVDRLIANGHPKQAMQEAGGVMEQLLRHVYGQVTAAISAEEQQKLAQGIEKIAKNKPVGDMTLGQLVGIFREGKVWDLAERVIGKKLASLRKADYDTFLDLRNRATHKGEEVNDEEARFFAAQLRLFIKTLGLIAAPPAKAPESSGGKAYGLRPWTEIVKLHADVESGSLAEAIFAIDLGAIATGDESTPKVYRDSDAFFAATYPTTDLRRLLEEVLASLAGQGNHNRVLKLRSPFGGGKSHTLASLLHAARSRKSLNQIAECRGYADPGKVDVAVFDGEKFTATGGKDVGKGKSVNTMWGWLAWQIGPKSYQVVEKHDQERVSPQGDEIKAMLAAEGRPVLLLLDEVLKYMEAAGPIILGDSTLQRQAMNFLQNLTVEVANCRNAVMVYSLQWSARQAMGNIALLQTLDTLVSRVDQVREPVTGDEVLAVVKRRLLAAEPPAETALQVAKEYVGVVAGFLRANAETETAKQDAESQAIELRSRMQLAYPFHPALIDMMNTRWTSVDGYQRTRGALRFLASCLHALKKKGGAKPLLGPGDIDLADGDVRNAMLKDLDPAQGYDPVIKSDIAGPGDRVRAKRIDERMAMQTPAMANVRPAQRLATAILAYSFGGLKRDGNGGTLPPGVSESELLAACIGPDLDSVTANSVLSDLRNSCLYLHYDGVRYCFKKDPNVTKLVEEAEQEVARDSDGLRKRIKEMLEERLAGKNDAVVWPKDSQGLPDREPQFLVAYLPMEFASETVSEKEDTAKSILSKCGEAPRRYKNGVGLAIPDKKPMESLRRAVRYLMAIERVDAKKKQHKLTKDQEDQLKERKRTEESAAESAFRVLYPSVWLPRVGSGGAIELEKVEVGGRPLQATGVHERVMEMLTEFGTKKVHGTLHPRKVAERVKLGEPSRLGVATSDVLDAFFEFLEPPRISSGDVLRKAIARGVGDGTFGYTTGTPVIGPAGKYQVRPTKVTVGGMSDDEVDLDSGFLIAPSALPAAAPPSDPGLPSPGQPPPGGEGPTPPEPGLKLPGAQVRTSVRIRFPASRDQVFKSFQAIANLADKSDSGKITLQIDGANALGYDPSWLRNAVEEPLDEANIEGLEME